MGGIRDTFGLLADLRPWLTSVERAHSLCSFMASRGHILRSVPRGCRAFFDAWQLAAFFSLMLEEAGGVVLDQRYAEFLGLGPASTEYGARILPAGDHGEADAPGWTSALADAGLVIEGDRAQLQQLLDAGEIQPIAMIDFPTCEFD